MLKESRNKYFWLAMLALMLCSLSTGFIRVWMGNIVIQLLAVVTSLVGGFFVTWFSLKENPGAIDSSDRLSAAGILAVCVVATVIFLLLEGLSKRSEIGLIVYAWSLGLGHISAVWYFKHLQPKR